MKIGIDIDDTMADTFDFLMPYISEFFKIDLEYLKENNISYSNIFSFCSFWISVFISFILLIFSDFDKIIA